MAAAEGGAIETVSQSTKEAPMLPSRLNNERFSLDCLLASQLCRGDLSAAKHSLSANFLALLLPICISQGNLDETICILNSIGNTFTWPSTLASTSHLKQHRGAHNASRIFAPFSAGSGAAVVCFSQFSTVISNIPIAANSKTYFELHILSCGESPQFGLATEKFAARCEHSADGVGDDTHSWAVDGVRHVLWRNGSHPAHVAWFQGDVVGFAVDACAYKCEVFVNGKSAIIFDVCDANGGLFSRTSTLFPAFSGSNCSIKINFGEDPFCFPVFPGRLMTAPPPAVAAPSLVDAVVKYLQSPRSAKQSSISDPVSVWNLSSNSNLRHNLSLDQMWQIAELCPALTSSASFLKGLFDRQQFAPQGPKTTPGSPLHTLQMCATADAVIQRLPNQKSSVAVALCARIVFHRLCAAHALGTCDAALLERYLQLQRTHFLECWCEVCCSARCFDV